MGLGAYVPGGVDGPGGRREWGEMGMEGRWGWEQMYMRADGPWERCALGEDVAGSRREGPGWKMCIKGSWGLWQMGLLGKSTWGAQMGLGAHWPWGWGRCARRVRWAREEGHIGEMGVGRRWGRGQMGLGGRWACWADGPPMDRWGWWEIRPKTVPVDENRIKFTP